MVLLTLIVYLFSKISIAIVPTAAREVKWSSVRDTLDLFIHKPFDLLFAGEYIPLPVRQEARQEAVAKGYIKGVESDFNMPSKEPSYTS